MIVKIDPNLFSMQIIVPHSEYGTCTYFMPDVLQHWLMDRDLQGHYCGGGSWGDGYTNDITNRESSYMVNNMQETDGLAFQIMFPKCKVYVCKQHEYA
jgi:hypothetical protein